LKDLQMEGKAQLPWRATGAWDQLLGDVLASGELVLDSDVPSYVNTTELGYEAD
jgi:hypothetical protein